mgnify:FL=1
MNARYTDRDMRTRSYEILEQTLDYKFNDSEFIIEALTHRSHKHEFGDSDHNERLEFLGDAVLDLCVTEMIMWRFRWKDEGHLSKLRSQLVSESALAKAARSIELGSFLRLGKGEEMGGGRDRDSLLADALEAIFGAIYIDSTLSLIHI